MNGAGFYYKHIFEANQAGNQFFVFSERTAYGKTYIRFQQTSSAPKIIEEF